MAIRRRTHGGGWEAESRNAAARLARGFTMVELLVVLTIMVILMALLLPAVQNAREAARTSSCANNLKQIGLGILTHEQSQGAFPTGGRRYAQTTRNKLGGAPAPFDAATPQNWSWPYQLLPYIEQQTLWSGTSDDVVAATPTSTYFCPSRRPPTALRGGPWPGPSSTKFRAMIDYAGNGGTSVTGGDWTNAGELYGGGDDGVFASGATAVVIRRMSQIKDGLSTTLFVGEKRMKAWLSAIETQPDDNDGYIGGFQSDVVRWAGAGTPWGDLVPTRDETIMQLPTVAESRYQPSTASLYPWIGLFGSSHAAGAMFVFGDGSVRMITFTVSPTSFQNLSGIRDGQFVDTTEL